MWIGYRAEQSSLNRRYDPWGARLLVEPSIRLAPDLLYQRLPEPRDLLDAMLVRLEDCRVGAIYIGSDITIKVLEIRKRQVKLGIEAPSGLRPVRDEIQPIVGHGKPCVSKQSFRR